MKKIFRVAKKSLLVTSGAFLAVGIFAYLLDKVGFGKTSELLIGLSIFLLGNVIVCLILWAGED